MSQNEEIEIRNLTKLYSLVLLKSKEHVSGYFILKRLEKDLGKTASPTYVYNFLKKLVAKGYIKKVKSKGSSRGKGYYLTPSGDDFIKRIMGRFDNLIEIAVQSKLKICASCGVKLYDGYYTEIIDGKEMNFCCSHCAKAFKNSI